MTLAAVSGWVRTPGAAIASGLTVAADNPISQSDPTGLLPTGPGTGGTTCTLANTDTKACGGNGNPSSSSVTGTNEGDYNTGDNGRGTAQTGHTTLGGVVIQNNNPDLAALKQAWQQETSNFGLPSSGISDYFAWTRICADSNRICGQFGAMFIAVSQEILLKEFASGVRFLLGGAHGMSLAGFAAGEIGIAASSGSGREPTVTIFRNVDANEFESIANTGKFAPGPGSMEGKWFAASAADADQWGELLNGGQGLTVETRIPQSVANQLFSSQNLDGIGPAYYANEEQLALISETMDEIQASDGA